MVVGSGQFYQRVLNGVVTEASSCDNLQSGESCYLVNAGLINDSYWGSGVTSVMPSPFSFNATGGDGSNVAGADLIIAGGKSTGTASGGSIRFQTSSGGTSSDVQNALQDRMTIDANGNVTIGDGSDRYSHSLIFHALYGDCGFNFDSDNGWLYSSCNMNMQGSTIFLRNMGAWINSPSGGNIKANSNQQISLQSPIIYLTGSADNYGTPNDTNVKVGIGTSNPQSRLAVSGLPNTPPDSSGTRGLVCITNDGNMWIDDDGDSNICQ